MFKKINYKNNIIYFLFVKKNILINCNHIILYNIYNKIFNVKYIQVITVGFSLPVNSLIADNFNPS